MGTALSAGKQPAGHLPPMLANLPPFPAVARKLLDLIVQDNCAMKEVSELIRSDAAFAVEVLRLANSALLGLRYEVTSILHAVSILGMDRIRALVLTVAMRDVLSRARREDILRQCWRHNLGAALVCEHVGELSWMNKSDCYTAGLLHDLGRLALIAVDPKRYLKAMSRRDVEGIDLLTAERDAFGWDHGVTGGWLASEWGFPGPLREVICLSATPPSGEWNMANLTRWSCDTVNQMGFTVAETAPPWEPERGQEGLPPDVRSKVNLTGLRDVVSYKINAFECEFLSR